MPDTAAIIGLVGFGFFAAGLVLDRRADRKVREATERLLQSKEDLRDVIAERCEVYRVLRLMLDLQQVRTRLDPETEREISDALKKRYGNSTLGES